MQPESGRPPEPNDEPLLPPATTQWRPLVQPTDEADLPLAPFFTGATEPAAASPERMPWEQPLPADAEAVAAPAVEDSSSEPWQPEGTVGDFPPDVFFIPENTLLEPDSTLMATAGGGAGGTFRTDAREDDTIVLLEHAGGEEDLERDLVEEVAAQLEDLAVRLREGGFAALSPRSAHPVDTVLAAVLSGYVAARAR